MLVNDRLLGHFNIAFCVSAYRNGQLFYVAAGNRTPVFAPIASLTLRPILCQQGTNKAQSNFTFHSSHNKFLDHVTHLSRWPLQGDIPIRRSEFFNLHRLLKLENFS